MKKQTPRTNFTTEQKIDFIIKVTEQQVPRGFVVTSLFFYVYVQHNIVIGPKFFNVSRCMHAFEERTF